MSKTKTSKAVTTAERNETRRDRWRRHIAERLENARGNEVLIPIEMLEEIEGRPMVDAILDIVCSQRGYGVDNPSPEQKLHKEIDDDYEHEGTLRRNNHEREIAAFAVFGCLMPRMHLIAPSQLQVFIRKFYRAGDYGLDAAIGRAIDYAVDGKDGPIAEPGRSVRRTVRRDLV